MEVQVNNLAVILATLSSLIIGSIWYARPVFGNAWIKLARINLKKKGAPLWVPIVVTAIVSLLTAYILAHLIYISNAYFGNSYMQDALTTAFWLWLGVVAARFVTHDGFEGRPWKLTVINTSNELVTFLVMGLILGSMGV